jgi:hypothetical protein
MTTIALFGAGGKMGFRLATHLQNSRFSTRCVEVTEAGRERLRTSLGIQCTTPAAALDGAEVVILAVPDTLIRTISAEISPSLKSGTMIIALDAAAPFAGHLPDRKDLVYFVTHPCHPPIFNDETEPAALRDHFGGVAARQSIVNALLQGPEDAFALGEEIARTIWAPVLRSHRVTVEQMALLEPGLSETVAATLLSVMREALDEVIARGVPKQAAQDFLLGHMNVLASVIFGIVEGRFSDACNKAIQFGKPALMRADWKHVFETAEIAASIQRIT